MILGLRWQHCGPADAASCGYFAYTESELQDELGGRSRLKGAGYALRCSLTNSK